MLINLSNKDIVTILTVLTEQNERLAERIGLARTTELKAICKEEMEAINDIFDKFDAIDDAEKKKYLDMTEEEQEAYDNNPDSYPICWM